MVLKLAYEDDCRFCTWAAGWADDTSDVMPIGFDQLTDEERKRLPADYEECAHLLTEDAVYSCGEATEQTLVRMGLVPEKLVAFLRQFENYERLREAVYHFISDHRDIWSRVLHAEAPVRHYPEREG